MALDLSALTNPYGQELAGIERGRALAAALMQSGQQQPRGEMISGRYVAPSFFQNLNPLLQTAVGLYGQNKADTQQAELTKNVQQKQAEILRAYTQAETPAQQFAVASNSYAPDYLKATIPDMLKTQNLAEGATLTKLNLGTGGYQEIAAGGIKTAPEMRQAMQQLGLNKPLDQLNPQELKAVNSQIEFNNRSKASTSVVNIPNFAEKTFAGGVAESQVKKFDALQTAAENAPVAIAKTQQLRKILDSGQFFSGKTANIQQDMALYADAVGLGGKDTATKAANTQSLITGAADATLNAITTSGLGSGQGFTDKDREFLQDARSFRITMNKENIKRVLDLNEKANLYSISKYNERIKTVPQSAVTSMGISPVQMPNSQLFNAADKIIGK
jgi:hypothetical protein